MFTVISDVLQIVERLLGLLSSARLTRLLDLADKCLDIAVCQWPSVHGRTRRDVVGFLLSSMLKQVGRFDDCRRCRLSNARLSSLGCGCVD
jgi:hypothetical protein